MFHHHPLGNQRRTINRVFEAAVLLLLAVLLLAAIPTMAHVPAATDIEPRPMAAPVPLAMADFPEHARVDGACIAILTRSSAVDDARSARAAAITSDLLADACFGA